MDQLGLGHFFVLDVAVLKQDGDVTAGILPRYELLQRILHRYELLQRILT